jgi:hypothetical protein
MVGAQPGWATQPLVMCFLWCSWYCSLLKPNTKLCGEFRNINAFEHAPNFRVDGIDMGRRQLTNALGR